MVTNEAAIENRGRLSLPHLQDQSCDDPHDYETISSFLNEGEEEEDVGDGVSHYTHVPPTTKDTSVEATKSPSSRSNSRAATHAKLLKIDSEGYASVLYPHETDNTWEFDCLNQDSTSADDNSSDMTVHNAEEAWKHQQERGYAPLTLQREPLPHFYRTSSAPSKSSLATSSAKPEPQDYEVPLKVLPPLPPPPSLAVAGRRRTSLMRQQAILNSPDDSSTFLSRLSEESSQEKEKENPANSTNEVTLNNSLCVTDMDTQMRSRVKSLPAQLS